MLLMLYLPKVVVLSSFSSFVLLFQDCEKEPSHCMEFTCRLAELKRGDSVEIKLNSRLWQNTLMKVRLR